MFKLSALVATATLCLSTSAYAGSTAEERLGRVLSVLGQQGIKNTEVVRKGDETIVRGTRNGRPVEVRVRREETVERGIRMKRHTRRADAEDTTSAPRQTQQTARAIASAQPADPTPAEASQINRLADETGLPKAPEQQTASTQEASQDDGLRNLPAGDMGAIYDTKDATVKAKQPSFSLGQLDMAKGPRSSPAILPE